MIYRVELSIEAANPREALEKASPQAAIGNAVVTDAASGAAIYMRVPTPPPLPAPCVGPSGEAKCAKCWGRFGIAYMYSALGKSYCYNCWPSVNVFRPK